MTTATTTQILEPPPAAAPAAAVALRSLADADAALRAGRAGEAVAAYRALAAHGSTGERARALYALGVVALRENDLGAAEQLLERSLALDPASANARFQLGFALERRGDASGALARYREALALDRDHVSARLGVERLAVRTQELPTAQLAAPAPVTAPMRVPAPPVPAPAPVFAPAPAPAPAFTPAPMPPPPPPPAPVAGVQPPSTRYGVYDYLSASDAPLSRQAVAVMDSLRVSRQPAFSAYLGRFLGRGAIVVLLGVLLDVLLALAAESAPPGTTTGLPQDAGALTALALAAVWGVTALEIACTRISIERGRLQVREGILRRRLTNVELWRVQDVALERSPLNLLTGDGTYAITLIGAGAEPAGRRRRGGDEPIRVTGLTRGAELEEVYQQLLNLTFLLRTLPAVKGIIQ